MQIVIEISDKIYEKVKEHYVNPYEVDEICEAILNGTPLPEHHGRLTSEEDIMTIEEARNILVAKTICLTRETSGTDTECNSRNCDNCGLNYEQGNMGEQKKALDIAIKALEDKGYEQGFADGVASCRDWLMD